MVWSVPATTLSPVCRWVRKKAREGISGNARDVWRVHAVHGVVEVLRLSGVGGPGVGSGRRERGTEVGGKTGLHSRLLESAAVRYGRMEEDISALTG
jgi:hypothetical protein